MKRSIDSISSEDEENLIEIIIRKPGVVTPKTKRIIRKIPVEPSLSLKLEDGKIIILM